MQTKQKQTRNYQNKSKKATKRKKDCLKAKSKTGGDFNTNQDSTESINTLRKILEKREKKSLGVLEKPDGTVTDPGIDTLEFLMKSHFPSITPPLPVTQKD